MFAHADWRKRAAHQHNLAVAGKITIGWRLDDHGN